jgi:hypothetical protein
VDLKGRYSLISSRMEGVLLLALLTTEVGHILEFVGNIAEGHARLQKGDKASNDYHGTAIIPGGL